MRVIGIFGPIGVGKSTLAHDLAEVSSEFLFETLTIRPFAAALKEMIFDAVFGLYDYRNELWLGVDAKFKAAKDEPFVDHALPLPQVIARVNNYLHEAGLPELSDFEKEVLKVIYDRGYSLAKA